MEFQLKDPRPGEPLGYLEQVAGRRVGTRLPFPKGVTFVGRQASACPWEGGHEGLAGVIEAAQVVLRWDDSGLWVTDATSTNQSTLIARPWAESYLADPFQVPPGALRPLAHEPFETRADARTWWRLQDGDLLVHAYGVWRVSGC